MEASDLFPSLAEIGHEQVNYEDYLAKLQAIQAKRLVEDRSESEETTDE